MASKKNLKKDINYLVDEVIGTCMMHQALDQKKPGDQMDKIIRDMMEFREKMLDKVNNPKIEGDEKKALKKYYKGLYTELLDKVNGIFEKLQVATE